jgi:hypothetical protein
MLCAALLHAQSEPKTGPDEATKEAQRQGRVALQPNAQQSPSESVQQAIAFERYKDLAAEREAQKEASAANAESSSAKAKHTAAVAKRK